MQLRHYLFIGILNPMLEQLASGDDILGTKKTQRMENHWVGQEMGQPKLSTEANGLKRSKKHGRL